MKKYTRKLSPAETLYLAYNNLTHPFANQFVIEGDGKINSSIFQSAVKKAAISHKGSMVSLKGALFSRRFVESDTFPEVKDFYIYDGLEAEFFNLTKSPIAEKRFMEILIIHCDSKEQGLKRIIFRTHHSLMDARGTMLFAKDVFNILKGKKAIGSDSEITEKEAAKSFQKKGRTPPPPIFSAPSGIPDKNASGVIWKRISIGGKHKNLLSKIIASSSGFAHENSENPNLRFAVPVDLRPRLEGIKSTANLTNLIYVNTNKKNSYEEIAADIKSQLENKNDGMLHWKDELIRLLPISFIEKEIKKEIKTQLETGLYRNSGIISNPGKLDEEDYSYGNFKMKTGFFIPPCNESIPLFIASSGTKIGVEICVGMPLSLGSGGRLEKFISKLEKDIISWKE